MFAKLFLSLFCAFFSTSSHCTPPAPLVPSLQVVPTVSASPSETFSFLTNITAAKGKNTYTILVSAPLASDGFQLHLKLPDSLSPTLTKSTVPNLNILTAHVLGSDIWLAGITKNPTQPWISSAPVEVGRFTLTSSDPSAIWVESGSTSNVLQHTTGINLLESGSASITLKKV